jgi:hypothetical protein
MDELKQPTGLFVALILGLLACYILGLGPACWLSSRFGGENVVTAIYRPVTFAAEVIGSDGLMEAMQSSLGENNFHWWMMSPDAPGHAEWMLLPPLFCVEFSGGAAIEYPLAPDEPPETPSSP